MNENYHIKEDKQTRPRKNYYKVAENIPDSSSLKWPYILLFINILILLIYLFVF